MRMPLSEIADNSQEKKSEASDASLVTFSFAADGRSTKQQKEEKKRKVPLNSQPDFEDLTEEIEVQQEQKETETQQQQQQEIEVEHQQKEIGDQQQQKEIGVPQQQKSLSNAESTAKKRKSPIKSRSTTESKEDEDVTCGICSCILNSFTLLERGAHVNLCLDKNGLNKGAKKSRISIKSIKNEDLDDDDDDDDDEGDAFADIFSPKSTSLLVANTKTNSRKVKSKAKQTDGKKLKATIIKQRGKKILSLCETEQLEHVKAVSLSEGDATNLESEGKSGGNEIPPTSSSSSRPSINSDEDKRWVKFSYDDANYLDIKDKNSYLLTEKPTKLHLRTANKKISDEDELQRLRLLLSKISAREANDRVQKAQALKTIRKIMKKPKKTLVIDLIENTKEGAISEISLEEKKEIEMKHLKSLKSATDILFPFSFQDQKYHLDQIVSDDNYHIEGSHQNIRSINYKGNNEKDGNFDKIDFKNEDANSQSMSRILTVFHHCPLWGLAQQREVRDRGGGVEFETISRTFHENFEGLNGFVLVDEGEDLIDVEAEFIDDSLGATRDCTVTVVDDEDSTLVDHSHTSTLIPSRSSSSPSSSSIGEPSFLPLSTSSSSSASHQLIDDELITIMTTKHLIRNLLHRLNVLSTSPPSLSINTTPSSLSSSLSPLVSMLSALYNCFGNGNVGINDIDNEIYLDKLKNIDVNVSKDFYEIDESLRIALVDSLKPSVVISTLSSGDNDNKGRRTGNQDDHVGHDNANDHHNDSKNKNIDSRNDEDGRQSDNDNDIKDVCSGIKNEILVDRPDPSHPLGPGPGSGPGPVQLSLAIPLSPCPSKDSLSNSSYPTFTLSSSSASLYISSPQLISSTANRHPLSQRQPSITLSKNEDIDENFIPLPLPFCSSSSSSSSSHLPLPSSEYQESIPSPLPLPLPWHNVEKHHDTSDTSNNGNYSYNDNINIPEKTTQINFEDYEFEGNLQLPIPIPLYNYNGSSGDDRDSNDDIERNNCMSSHGLIGRELNESSNNNNHNTNDKNNGNEQKNSENSQLLMSRGRNKSSNYDNNSNHNGNEKDSCENSQGGRHDSSDSSNNNYSDGSNSGSQICTLEGGVSVMNKTSSNMGDSNNSETNNSDSQICTLEGGVSIINKSSSNSDEVSTNNNNNNNNNSSNNSESNGNESQTCTLEGGVSIINKRSYNSNEVSNKSNEVSDINNNNSNNSSNNSDNNDDDSQIWTSEGSVSIINKTTNSNKTSSNNNSNNNSESNGNESQICTLEGGISVINKTDNNNSNNNSDNSNASSQICTLEGGASIINKSRNNDSDGNNSQNSHNISNNNNKSKNNNSDCSDNSDTNSKINENSQICTLEGGVSTIRNESKNLNIPKKTYDEIVSDNHSTHDKENDGNFDGKNDIQVCGDMEGGEINSGDVDNHEYGFDYDKNHSDNFEGDRYEIGCKNEREVVMNEKNYFDLCTSTPSTSQGTHVTPLKSIMKNDIDSPCIDKNDDSPICFLEGGVSVCNDKNDDKDNHAAYHSNTPPASDTPTNPTSDTNKKPSKTPSSALSHSQYSASWEPSPSIIFSPNEKIYNGISPCRDIYHKVGEQAHEMFEMKESSWGKNTIEIPNEKSEQVPGNFEEESFKNNLLDSQGRIAFGTESSAVNILVGESPMGCCSYEELEVKLERLKRAAMMLDCEVEKEGEEEGEGEVEGEVERGGNEEEEEEEEEGNENQQEEEEEGQEGSLEGEGENEVDDRRGFQGKHNYGNNKRMQISEGKINDQKEHMEKNVNIVLKLDIETKIKLEEKRRIDEVQVLTIDDSPDRAVLQSQRVRTVRTGVKRPLASAFYKPPPSSQHSSSTYSSSNSSFLPAAKVSSCSQIDKKHNTNKGIDYNKDSNDNDYSRIQIDSGTISRDNNAKHYTDANNKIDSRNGDYHDLNGNIQIEDSNRNKGGWGGWNSPKKIISINATNKHITNISKDKNDKNVKEKKNCVEGGASAGGDKHRGGGRAKGKGKGRGEICIDNDKEPVGKDQGRSECHIDNEECTDFFYGTQKENEEEPIDLCEDDLAVKKMASFKKIELTCLPKATLPKPTLSKPKLPKPTLCTSTYSVATSASSSSVIPSTASSITPTAPTPPAHPVAIADMFKANHQPQFDIYTISELHQFGSLYGLKKDTKPRLVKILESMWRRTQLQSSAVPSSSTVNSSNPSLPSSASSSSLPPSSSIIFSLQSSSSSLPSSLGINSSNPSSLITSTSSSNTVDLLQNKENTIAAVCLVQKATRKPRAKKALKAQEDSTVVPTGSESPEKTLNVEKINRKRKKNDKNDLDLLNDEVMEYIRNQPDLFMQVLCFEPLDLDVLHARLNDEGKNMSKDELLSILDCNALFISRDSTAKQRVLDKKNEKKDEKKQREMRRELLKNNDRNKKQKHK